MSEDPFLDEMMKDMIEHLMQPVDMTKRWGSWVMMTPAQIEEYQEWLSANPAGTPLSESQKLALSVPHAVGEPLDFQSQSVTESGSNSEKNGS